MISVRNQKSGVTVLEDHADTHFEDDYLICICFVQGSKIPTHSGCCYNLSVEKNVTLYMRNVMKNTTIMIINVSKIITILNQIVNK